MIVIQPERVYEAIPDEWRARARAVTEEMASADPADRPSLIEANAAIWRELKTALQGLSHGKCWYCESRENRSDNAVDHYRPKGRLAEDASHGGYWWLAFVGENFRFSCTFCNSRRTDQLTGDSGGKQDRFPLVDEIKRAWNPTDDLEAEQPILLDPCRISDVSLLWFDDSGGVVIHPNWDCNEMANARVEGSREIYHLDHSQLVEQRRRVYMEVTLLARRIDASFTAITDTQSASREMFEQLVRELSRRADSRSEHSRVARCAIKGLRASSGAAQAVLELST